MSLSQKFGPHLRLLGMAVLWGASWPAGRILALNMPPLAASGVRFVLAVSLLLPWLYFSGGLPGIKAWPRKTWLGMCAAGATGVFGYAAFFLTGLQHLPAGKAALVITLNPVVTLLMAVWLFKERINRLIASGMLLAALGAVVVISHGRPLELLSGAAGIGELLILGCVACWVTYTLIGRAMLGGVDALAATTVTSCVGAVLLLAASLAVEGPQAIASVFGAGREVPLRTAAARYFSLAALLLTASFGMLTALTDAGFATLPAKIVTDLTLFAVSFSVQRAVVFAPVPATLRSRTHARE